MSTVHGLTVRQFERHDVGLAAVLRLSNATSEVVHLSANTDATSDDIRGIVVDVGDGGLGVRCALFLPRGSTMHVTVPRPEGVPGKGPLLNADIRIQRVIMQGRDPAMYLLGMAFVDRGDQLAKQVKEVQACASTRVSTPAGGPAA